MNLTPVYEKWRQETLQEGLQQGLQQGLQRGRQDGERSLVLRLLNRRIGILTSALESQIQALSVAQLEALGEALLDFTEMANLDEWLKSQS